MSPQSGFSSLPFSRQSSPAFVRLPSGCVLAHYHQQPGGAWVVVSSRGQVLGPSFFAIRGQWFGVCVLAGAGGWAVLVPAISRPVLF
jgi:hypothetical protein